jgi:dTDP-4-amino-4,6-dideoxygalactose transaminase
MIRLSRSIVGDAESRALQAVIERGFLGMGTEVQAFEQDLAVFLGEKMQVVCVNTGTAALHLALQAIGVGVGDEVLVPSLTYVASFQAISATGATPVACDVLAENGLIDLKDAHQRITDRTKAIMPVHYASDMGDLASVYAFAKTHRLRVVEDAAHAFGCEYQGEKIGSFGDVICFSFDGIKNITSGEGGAVVSRDTQVIKKVQDARLLAVQGDTEKRYQGQRSWDFDVTEQGWRYHMSELMAAIGRVQLQRFEGEFKPQRMALVAHYREQLAGISSIRLFAASTDLIVPHIFPIQVPSGQRDAFRQWLFEQGVQTGVHYLPNHLLTRYGGGSVSLPVVETLHAQLVSLPLHAGLTREDVDTIVGLIKKYDWGIS